MLWSFPSVYIVTISSFHCNDNFRETNIIFYDLVKYFIFYIIVNIYDIIIIQHFTVISSLVIDLKILFYKQYTRIFSKVYLIIF